MFPTIRQHPERQSSSCRLHRRYPIRADLEYRLLGDNRAVKTGTGQTVNLSSSGVLFESEDAVAPGMLVELAVPWPARLNDKVGLTLCIVGRTVRVERNCTALEILRHEFRTRLLQPPAHEQCAPASQSASRTIPIRSSGIRQGATPTFAGLTPSSRAPLTAGYVR
jgi:hypothetical protein